MRLGSSCRAILILALTGCTSYSPDLGTEPFLCGADEPRCPDGYTCVVGATQSVCSNRGGAGSGSGSGSGSNSGNCAMAFSGVLATWSLTGQPGTQTSTPSTSSASGVSAGALTRASGLTAGAGTNSINSSNWPTGTLDPTKYYAFTLTPPSGCTLSASQLAIDLTTSGTGPTSSSVATSADSFGATTTVSPTTASTPSLSVTAHSGMLEVRVYGFSAGATTGTMRIQNTLSITGSLQ
jgi:hypothetical protein